MGSRVRRRTVPRARERVETHRRQFHGREPDGAARADRHGFDSGCRGQPTAAIRRSLEPGWSRIGAGVDLLVLLDPPLQNPWWINLSFIWANRLCSLTRLTDTIRWQIIRRWDSLLLRCMSDEGLCTHVSILRERKAEPYLGRIVFFRPRRSWIRLVGRTRIGMSWHKISRDGLEVHRVPGAHNEMLRGRQGRIFAGVLRSCLKRGRRAASGPRLQHPASWEVKHGANTLYSASVKPGRIDEVFYWDAMEQLHQRGLICDPVEAVRSSAFVGGELRETARSISRLFAAND